MSLTSIDYFDSGPRVDLRPGRARRSASAILPTADLGPMRPWLALRRGPQLPGALAPSVNFWGRVLQRGLHDDSEL